METTAIRTEPLATPEHSRDLIGTPVQYLHFSDQETTYYDGTIIGVVDSINGPIVHMQPHPVDGMSLQTKWRLLKNLDCQRVLNDVQWVNRAGSAYWIAMSEEIKPGNVYKKATSRRLSILIVAFLEQGGFGESWLGCAVLSDGTIGKPCRVTLTDADVFTGTAPIPADALALAERMRVNDAQRLAREQADDSFEVASVNECGQWSNTYYPY